MPLSIRGYRTDRILDRIAPQIEGIEYDERISSRERREKLSHLLKSKNIDMYAEIWSLLGQVGFLVVLYQIVTVGIKPEGFHAIYSFIPHPSFVNTEFFGIDISKPSALLSVIAALALFVDLSWEYLTKRRIPYRRFSERWFPLLLPVFTYIILILLPATKALFIFTSVVFSLVLRLIIDLALRGKE